MSPVRYVEGVPTSALAAASGAIRGASPRLNLSRACGYAMSVDLRVQLGRLSLPNPVLVVVIVFVVVGLIGWALRFFRGGSMKVTSLLGG